MPEGIVQRMTEESGANNSGDDDSQSMGREERVRQVLGLLVETELHLPPHVILHNCKERGATFERRTVNRYLKELKEDGYVARVDGTDGFYKATERGRKYYFSDY
jgi:repressor of nif and glnA expression